MKGQLGDLVDGCMKIKNELKEVSSIMIAMLPPYFWKYHLKQEMPLTQEEQKQLKEKGQILGGFEKVSKRFDSLKKEFDEKISILAETLEEEDFEVERLRGDLTEEQLSWIKSHIREIKQHLSGIEIT